MKSRQDVDEDAPRPRDEFDDEEDQLPVPASPFRIVLGIVMLVSGFLVGGFGEGSWLTYVGLAVLMLSFRVMLRYPDKS